MLSHWINMRTFDLNHLHLHVKKIDSSKKFYRRYFEFKKHVYHSDLLFLRNESQFDLALQPDKNSYSFPNWFHFGFRLKSSNQVKELYKKMLEDNVPIDKDLFEAVDLVSFRCKDPDGYKIEIYWE